MSCTISCWAVPACELLGHCWAPSYCDHIQLRHNCNSVIFMELFCLVVTWVPAYTFQNTDKAFLGFQVLKFAALHHETTEGAGSWKTWSHSSCFTFVAEGPFFTESLSGWCSGYLGSSLLLIWEMTSRMFMAKNGWRRTIWKRIKS